MIRLTELKLPLTDVPVEHRRAADAPTETDADRAPPPHPLRGLAVGMLNFPLCRIGPTRYPHDFRPAQENFR